MRARLPGPSLAGVRAGACILEPMDLKITPEALESLLQMRGLDPEPDRLGLRVRVTGIAGDSYEHEMSFELLASAEPTDVLADVDGLPVLMPGESVEKLAGATIDAEGEAWTIHNPNRPPLRERVPLQVMPAGGHGNGRPSSPAADAGITPELRASLTGDVGQRVAQVIEQHVNPNIASHGGNAELVGVQGERAYLKLSGGCQGCGMAAVTLRQGIERAITQLVPEIREIVDVTDHASGENPYYTPEHAH